ncbi:MAG: peptide deformylase [Parcubacteria group bacterium Gr01-1014_46]|nr:MAG: peptide deformylase [Parcubacteria group bacterium Gr01-1014_46]
MTTKILQKDAEILREIALPVAVEEIKSIKIKKVLSEMKEALDSQEDGVAIAAPQIGHSLRIFVVSRKVEDILAETKRKKTSLPTKQIEGDLAFKTKDTKDLVFINPTIKKLSKERKTVEEGCLSVRYLYGQVSRSKKATVVAFDENGNKFERGGTGLLAQIFQHEMDHLDGVLFIDKAQNVEEIFPEEYKKNGKSRKTK